MEFEMRPYQLEAIQRARERLAYVRAGILKLATGTGKTIIAAKIVEAAAAKGKRVLFMAHTDELVQQAGDKISRASGVQYDIEKAGLTAHQSEHPLVVASVQSLSRQKRLDRFDKSAFDLVITDETHRGAADSYVRIYDHFDKAKLLGLTATPFRSDDRSLGSVYDEVVFDYGIEKAIEEGYLCPIISETIPLEIDLSGVHIQNGEYKASEAAEAIEPFFDAMAAKLAEKASDRKLCVFLPVITASKKFTNILRDHGFQAQHVDGGSKDRKEILEWFDGAGPGSAICNVAVLTEGWDCPSVDCVVVATPLRSTLRYIQMVGRGTRLSPETGKHNLYVPDFLWHGAQHNLCHPANLFARTEEVAERMTEIQKKGGTKDLQQLEEEAHTELVSEREAALANSLKAFVGNKSKKFDPVLQSVSLVDDSLVDWKPETKSEALPADADQLARLERHGFDAAGWKHGYADRVLKNLDDRIEKGLATPRQIRCLLRNGYPRAQNMTFAEASAAMNVVSEKWNKLNKYKQKRRRR